MAADGKQLELWKTVVGAGGVLIGTGAALLAAKSEFYGAILLAVGLLLVVLGLAYANGNSTSGGGPQGFQGA